MGNKRVCNYFDDIWLGCQRCPLSDNLKPMRIINRFFKKKLLNNDVALTSLASLSTILKRFSSLNWIVKRCNVHQLLVTCIRSKSWAEEQKAPPNSSFHFKTFFLVLKYKLNFNEHDERKTSIKGFSFIHLGLEDSDRTREGFPTYFLRGMWMKINIGVGLSPHYLLDCIIEAPSKCHWIGSVSLSGFWEE